MKFLFDQNLSPKLLRLFQSDYPDSQHVREADLRDSDDTQVWDYAARHDFVIVTKDSDFQELSILRGAPPKLIWIRRGNCSTDAIVRLLRSNELAIKALAADQALGFLTLD